MTNQEKMSLNLRCVKDAKNELNQALKKEQWATVAHCAKVIAALEQECRLLWVKLRHGQE